MPRQSRHYIVMPPAPSYSPPRDWEGFPEQVERKGRRAVPGHGEGWESVPWDRDEEPWDTPRDTQGHRGAPRALSPGQQFRQQHHHHHQHQHHVSFEEAEVGSPRGTTKPAGRPSNRQSGAEAPEGRRGGKRCNSAAAAYRQQHNIYSSEIPKAAPWTPSPRYCPRFSHESDERVFPHKGGCRDGSASPVRRQPDDVFGALGGRKKRAFSPDASRNPLHGGFGPPFPPPEGLQGFRKSHGNCIHRGTPQTRLW